MANNKQIKTRLQQLHGYEADWIKAGNNSGFVPLEGEEILYMAETEETELPEYRSEPITYNRKKIGDGVTNINLLPFENETLRNNIATLINDVQALENTTATSEQLNAAIERITTLEEKQATELIVTEITLAADDWTGDTSPYTQTLEIPNASPTSQINLHPTTEQIIDLQNQNITLTVGNNNGIVTFYAINNKPAADYNIVITITDALSVDVTPAEEGTFLTKTEGASKEYVNLINETTEKRLERLETKLAPEYIIEDHEYAYEKTVPYYSCKYADLEWMDGYSYVDSEGHLKDAKVTEIVSECANLWDVNFVDVSGNKGMYEKTETGYITVYGASIGTAMLTANYFLQRTGLKAGDTITCSCKASTYSGTSYGSSGLIMLLSKNTNTHSNVYLRLPGNLGQWTTKTVTLPTDFSNDTYHGIYFYGSNKGQIEFSDLIISKGSEKVPYQEYRPTTVIAIPEETQAIEGYGRKGTRLNFEDKTLSVTYGKYTFTGNESWTTPTLTEGFYRSYTLSWEGYAQSKMPSSVGAAGVCDRYSTNLSSYANPGQESVRFGQANAAFYIYLSEQKTSAEIQELTRGMIVHYPLKSEYQTLTSVDIDFDGLLPVGGMAKVRFENEDQTPVQSKITYMLKEDAQFEETSEITE